MSFSGVVVEAFGVEQVPAYQSDDYLTIFKVQLADGAFLVVSKVVQASAGSESLLHRL